MEDQTNKLWFAWQEAAERPEIDQAIRALYEDLDQAIAKRQPVCNASGRCCRFEEFGHRLYVTGLEIAWFLLGVRALDNKNADDPSQTSADPDDPINTVSLQQLAPTPNPQNPIPPNCPYQIKGFCSTHTIRPLGCRVFFCQQGTEAWQQDTTEHFLDRLKQLHAAHKLPYAYMEWRAGLAEASQQMP